MGYKSILTVLTGAESDKAALGAAAQLATMQDAHLDVLCLGIDRVTPDPVSAGVVTMTHEISLKEAYGAAERAGELAKRQLADHTGPWGLEQATALAEGLWRIVVNRMQYMDLAVLARPYGTGSSWESEVVAEAAIFDSGTPVMFVNEETLPDFTQSPVLVGWNNTPAALAAVRAALPFIEAAPSTQIAMVDPPRDGSDRSDPGGQLAQMLARHGARVEVNLMPKTQSRAGGTLVKHATDMGAGLLVMGAYGHSRLREAIFGGATRSALENATVPVLMAR